MNMSSIVSGLLFAMFGGHALFNNNYLLAVICMFFSLLFIIGDPFGKVYKKSVKQPASKLNTGIKP